MCQLYLTLCKKWKNTRDKQTTFIILPFSAMNDLVKPESISLVDGFGKNIFLHFMEEKTNAHYFSEHL